MWVNTFFVTNCILVIRNVGLYRDDCFEINCFCFIKNSRFLYHKILYHFFTVETSLVGTDFLGKTFFNKQYDEMFYNFLGIKINVNVICVQTKYASVH